MKCFQYTWNRTNIVIIVDRKHTRGGTWYTRYLLTSEYFSGNLLENVLCIPSIDVQARVYILYMYSQCIRFKRQYVLCIRVPTTNFDLISS